MPQTTIIRGPRAAAKLGDKPAARAKKSAWTTRRARGLEILQARPLAALDWLVHGFATRRGGESVLDGKRALNLGFTDWDEPARVESNRRKLAAALGAGAMPLVTLRQIHSDIVHRIASLPKEIPRGDALATRARGLLLGVQTADCVPLLLADVRTRAVAAVHAGWRGTLARIAAKTIGRMQMEFGTRPRDLVAAIGPAIGRCCYEVGPEVAQAYAAQFSNAREWFEGPFDQLAAGEEPLALPWLSMMPPGHTPPPPRVHLDLHAANRRQLLDAGMLEENIVVSDLCTACRTDLLFSYRGEGAKTGRMMAVIGVRKS